MESTDISADERRRRISHAIERLRTRPYAIRDRSFLEAIAVRDPNHAEEVLDRCDKEYKEFNRLRGDIIGASIDMEHRLARVIAFFFYPYTWGTSIGNDVDEDAAHTIGCLRARLIEILLPEITFKRKFEVLRGILENDVDFGRLRRPVEDYAGKLEKLCKSVTKRRNALAHHPAELDFKQCAVYLRAPSTARPVRQTTKKLAQDMRACQEAQEFLDNLFAAILQVQAVEMSDREGSVT